MAGLGGGSPTSLVNAAVLAANAHNTQPWRFRVGDDHVDLLSDPARTIGAIDPLLREFDLSLGCALENMALAAPLNGFDSQLSMLPGPGDNTWVARMGLTRRQNGSSAGVTTYGAFDVDQLARAIPSRHTNRAAYDTSRQVSPTQLDALASVAASNEVELVWMPRAFADHTIAATKAIIADPEQADDDFRWYRENWRDIQQKQDGVTIETSGTTPLIRSAAKLVPVSRKTSHDGWLSTTRMQLPTASAFGALIVADPTDRRLRLAAGRAWQRTHLAATSAGLAAQPLCQVLERVERDQSLGRVSEFAAPLARLLPAGRHALMTFRVGYPTVTAPRSPRRPAHRVILNSAR